MSFGITGKVSVDSSGFFSGMKRLEGGAQAAGKVIGRQLQSQIMAYLGGAAIIGVIRNTFEKAFNIRKDAGAAGVPVEQYQTLLGLADKTGESIESLVELYTDGTEEAKAFADSIDEITLALIEQKKIMDEGTVNRNATRQEQIEEIKQRSGNWLADMMDKAMVFVGQKIPAAIMASLGEFGNSDFKDEYWQVAAEMLEEIETGKPKGILLDEKDPAVQSPYDAIVSKIRKRMADRKAQKKDEPEALKTEEEKRGISGRLDVSSDTQIGRFFSQSGLDNPMTNELRTLNRQVGEIRNRVSKFSSL